MLLAVSRELFKEREKNLTNIAEIKCNFEMIFWFLKAVTEKLTKNGTVVLQQICICSHDVIWNYKYISWNYKFILTDKGLLLITYG